MLDLLGVIGVQTVFRTYPKTPLRAYILFNTTMVMWSCCSNVKLSKWLCFWSLLDHREAEVLLYFLHVNQCWQLPVDYYYTHIERWAHSRSFTCYIISSEVHCVNNTHHSCRWREVFWWRLLCFGLWGSCSPDGCGFRWVSTSTFTEFSPSAFQIEQGIFQHSISNLTVFFGKHTLFLLVHNNRIISGKKNTKHGQLPEKRTFLFEP